MTTKILSGSYGGGYGIHAPTTILSLTSTGYVGGDGIYAAPGATAAYTIVNEGRISGSVGSRAGVYVPGGGRLTNGSASDTAAAITGDAQGAVFHDTAIVVNFGTIASKTTGQTGGTGLILASGGAVTNGSATDKSALIGGYYSAVDLAAVGTLSNFGTITSEDVGDLVAGEGAVTFRDGGLLTNGSTTDTTALIDGYGGTGVIASGGSVVNNAIIEGGGVSAQQYGVRLANGACLTNGSTTNTTALIEGYAAVAADSATSKVTNYGTILNSAGAAQSRGYMNLVGVDLDGGLLANGSASDTAAVVKGYSGVTVASGGTVINFGFINSNGDAAGAYGVLLADGGVLTNGSATDQTAFIAGNAAVRVRDGQGTVANFGQIESTGVGSYGASLYGGILTNGVVDDNAALITGQAGGVAFIGSGTLANGGKVEGGSVNGVVMFDGGRVINGAANNQNVEIVGAQGVYAVDGATILTNYGVIDGTGGTAVRFLSSGDTLLVETACEFIGAVLGGGGTLDLASGAGTISGLAAGNAQVSGVTSLTTFSDFNVVEVGAGALFTLAGAGTIIGGQILKVAGGLIVGGQIAGAGAMSLVGGVTTFDSGTSLMVAKVTMAGASTMAQIATKLVDAESWIQAGGTLSVAAGDHIDFTAIKDDFSGTLAGSGTIDFAGGSDVLKAVTLSSGHIVINTATVYLEGAVDLTGILTATTKNLTIIAGGATLTGGGTLVLTNAATNSLHGATATAELTNGDRIEGAGQLGAGKMSLVNQAGGAIFGNDALALVIDTGAQTIVNAGLIEAAGAGGVTIDSAIANTGTLKAAKGVLRVDGAVTGAGMVAITGGTADFAENFSESVSFSAAGGDLELAKSQTYAGTISGFSKTGASSLDLRDIAFGAGTKATYSGTAAAGVLTITDGSHTAKIKLSGDYTASTFDVSSDGHGGTTVVDPSASPASHAFIAAMAAMGGGGGAVKRALDWAPRAEPHPLAAPRPLGA